MLFHLSMITTTTNSMNSFSFSSFASFAAAATSLTVFILSFSSSAATLPSFLPGPWEAFVNLSGCHPGEKNPGLADLKYYLHHFGYFPSDSKDDFTDHFDDALETAVKTYQHNFHLDVTGVLDFPTISQLILPRCGVADIINGSSSMDSTAMGSTHARGLFAFFPNEPKWPQEKRKLIYAFTSTSAVDINSTVLRAVFARAFSRWSAATTLSFSEAGDAEEADINIGFFSGDHGDGEPFDGVLGTLAHAFSPTNGRFHLDAAEQWVAEGDVTAAESTAAVDLESVAVHEIGHLLGLGHSGEEAAIMFPTIKTRTRKVELTEDDVKGIQKLYGGNPNFTGVAPAATTTTTTVQERDTNGGRKFGLGVGWGLVVARFLVVLAAVVSLIS